MEKRLVSTLGRSQNHTRYENDRSRSYFFLVVKSGYSLYAVKEALDPIITGAGGKVLYCRAWHEMPKEDRELLLEELNYDWITGMPEQDPTEDAAGAIWMVFPGEAKMSLGTLHSSIPWGCEETMVNY